MRIFATLAVAVSIVACAGEQDGSRVTPDVIKLGVLPDQKQEQLRNRYGPLVDYLTRDTGMIFELVIPADYSALLDDFDANRIHIANFGGLTFTEAERQSRAEPLVMRDVDRNFTSCYLVAGSDQRGTLQEFAGESFVFGPALSTSGYLMPRHFMKRSGLDPEYLFASIHHSSGHDETAAWIGSGKYAIGVANCVIVETMIREGRLRPSDVRILETTPAYSNYVWAVQESLDATLKTVLRDAFLELNAAIPEHAVILRLLGANAYLPAGRSDFDDVRFAVKESVVHAAESK